MSPHNGTRNYVLSCFEEGDVIIESRLVVIFQVFFFALLRSVVNDDFLSIHAFERNTLTSNIKVIWGCDHIEAPLNLLFYNGL